MSDKIQFLALQVNCIAIQKCYILLTFLIVQLVLNVLLYFIVGLSKYRRALAHSSKNNMTLTYGAIVLRAT